MDATLFDRLGPEHIRREPFPHAVIDDALPADLCRRLIDTRPSISPPPRRPAVRTIVPAWMLSELPHYDPLWRDFAARHVRADIPRRVRALFGADWPAHLPEPPVEDGAYGTLWRDGHDSHPILCDARLELVSPNPETPASHRGPHLDAPNRLFSALYYLRAPDDDSEGGGLGLYRYRNGRPPRLDVNAFEPDQVAEAAVLDYRANRLVVFPNHPDAIHGAVLRQPTGHDRAYVFVTAEVAADLF